MLRTAVALACWVALAVGMVWTGKAGKLASDPPPPPFAATELAIEDGISAEIEIEAAADGEADLRFAIEVGGEGDASELLSWLQKNDAPALSLALRWHSASDPKIEESRVLKKLEYIASRVEESRARWILHESKLEVTAGEKYKFQASLTGTDASVLADRAPVFLLGKSVEVLPVTKKGPLTPGFVLLCGAAGVFVHLLMIWGRLMVPLREAIAAEGDLI
ncbi:MAG: hypothetical protein V3W41_08075 [Planctomycetota bacterium]